MKRYDIAICDCPLGPHLEVHEHDGGEHIDASEALAEIAKLKALFAEMSLPMHDDQRYRDVTVQIDRETYERTKALLLDGEP